MRYLMILVAIALFTSCDSGGKKESHSIDGKSPEEFYQTFVDNNKKDCEDIILGSQQPPLKIQLFNDRTFVLESGPSEDKVTQGIGKQVGTWSVHQKQLILISENRHILAVGDPFQDNQKVRFSWQQAEHIQKMAHGFHIVQKAKRKCQTVTVKNDAGAAQKLKQEKFEYQLDPDARTIKLLTPPKVIMADVYLLKSTKALFKFLKDRTLSEACELEAENTVTDKNLLIEKYEMLTQEAGILDFDLPTRAYPDDLYAKVEEEVEKGAKEETGMDINFTYVDETIAVDDTMKINKPGSFAVTLQQAAQSHSELSTLATLMDTYVPKIEGQKYTVNIGQLCDVVQKNVQHSVVWTSGEEKGLPVPLGLNVWSLNE